jgi:transposase
MHNDRKGPDMVYVGMDVSSKSFVVHAIDERKRVVWRGEVAPTRSGLKRALEQLGPQAKLVVVEAGNQLKWIARELGRMKGVTLHVVHPNEVKWISQSNGKTDKVDARKLAELARGELLPRKVHVVDGHIRELRELVGARHTLQSKRVALINTIRAYFKQEGHRLPEKFFQRRDWAQALGKLRVSAVTQQIVEGFKTSIDALQQSEAALTRRLVAIKDERITRLESIPSIGAISARVVVGALDDARRFDNKKCAAKYGALTPTLYQSGDLVHLGRINRDGRQEVRRVLLQCAHTLARMKSTGARPLRAFYERVQRRRGKKIAIVALARKLLTTAYGVLKSGAFYDPAKLLPHGA